MQQDEDLLVDPEEQMEGRLVHKMALVIVAIIAFGILFLAIRPWIQRFREQDAEQEAT
jgi:flagellar biosynthesis/type III secretory pathway M-ring protein FliF/YscJ